MIHSGSSQQALWMDYNHRLYPKKKPNMDNDTVFSLMVKVREAGNNLTFINYLDQKKNKKKITFFIRKAKIINLGSTCILVIGRI